MPDLIQIGLTNLGVVAAMMFVMWLISLACRDASIVDPFWGFGFVVVTWSTVLQVESVSPRGWLLAVLASVWGLRLSGYLLKRNWGEGEDRRYTEMREHHGNSFWWVSLYLVFGLQGLVMWLVSAPLQAGVIYNTPLNWIDAAAGAVWLLGFFFESVGDYQMARFKSQPDSEGEVMNSGLWRYTRHPNYFGDFCVWWGHFLFAAAAGAWWTFYGPIIMSIFLLRVSGVTMLEKDISDRRPKYEEYKRRTNTFFPGPPKPAGSES